MALLGRAGGPAASEAQEGSVCGPRLFGGVAAALIGAGEVVLLVSAATDAA